MAQQSYGIDQLIESIMDESAILDPNTRTSYKIMITGVGRRRRPACYSGRFCVAFVLAGHNGKLCYRVWKELIPDTMERYRLIDKRVSSSRLEYFGSFHYIPSALRLKCNGETLPGIVMDWIEGKTLDSFLKEDWPELPDVERLTFIRDFYLMCCLMRENKTAHGDLSSSNILVTPERDIRLVDYDSMYVAEMGDKFYQVTGGTEGFQHPERINSTEPLLASIDDDNFSQLVIALSLWVAYYDPTVTSIFDDKNLLFLPGDFDGATGIARLQSLKRSNGWKRAEKVANSHSHIAVLMRALESVQYGLKQVPSLTRIASKEVILSVNFHSLLRDTSIAPIITEQKVEYCTMCGTRFDCDNFGYCTACGTKRHIYNI